MDPFLDALSKDFDGLLLALRRYARKLVRDKFWRGEYLADCDPQHFVFPGGQSVDDLVLTVFEKVLAETRTWDQSRFPELLPVLKGMVKSEVDNALKKEENATTRVLSLEESDERNYDFEANVGEHHSEIIEGTRLTPQSFRAHPGEVPSPEEFSDELMREVEGDEELQAVVLAIRFGAQKASDVAEVSGIPVKRVYELNRKLDEIADTVTRAVMKRRAEMRFGKEGDQHGRI